MKKKEHLVSVIMPAYDAESYISIAIESVLNQSYKNWELIIIEDRSKDNTLEVIKSFSVKDQRIKYFINEKNSGPAFSRNRGIDLAFGEFIAFLDSDDAWLHDKLEKQLHFMYTASAVISCTATLMIDETGNEISRTSVKKEITYYDLLGSNSISLSTVIYNRKHLAKDRFPSIYHEDYALWLTILKREKKAHGLNLPLTRYTVRASSISGNKKRAAIGHWRIYRDFLKFPLFKSCYFFMIYVIKSLIKYQSHFFRISK